MSANSLDRIAARLLSVALLAGTVVCQPLPGTAGQSITKSKVKPAIKLGSKDSYASCFDVTDGKYLGSRTVRTETLISPDRRFRAYAESEAVGSEADAGFPTCANTSKLMVAGPDGQFRMVLAVESVPEKHGNSIALVDWSPVGHQLLLTEGTWEWASEVGEGHTRTYDADTGALSTKTLLADAFSKHFARRCAAVFETQGFSADSKVIVIAKPWFDFGDEVPSKDSCSGKAGTWSIDFASGAMTRVADGFKVVQRAKILPGSIGP